MSIFSGLKSYTRSSNPSIDHKMLFLNYLYSSLKSSSFGFFFSSALPTFKSSLILYFSLIGGGIGFGL